MQSLNGTAEKLGDLPSETEGAGDCHENKSGDIGLLKEAASFGIQLAI